MLIDYFPPRSTGCHGGWTKGHVTPVFPSCQTPCKQRRPGPPRRWLKIRPRLSGCPSARATGRFQGRGIPWKSTRRSSVPSATQAPGAGAKCLASGPAVIRPTGVLIRLGGAPQCGPGDDLLRGEIRVRAERRTLALNHHPHQADWPRSHRFTWPRMGCESAILHSENPLDRARFENHSGSPQWPLDALDWCQPANAKASTCRRFFLWWRILDAGQGGFLRPSARLISDRSPGPARPCGWQEPLLYRPTTSRTRMAKAISETERRRSIQQTYNETHGSPPLRPASGRQLDPPPLYEFSAAGSTMTSGGGWTLGLVQGCALDALPERWILELDRQDESGRQES